MEKLSKYTVAVYTADISPSPTLLLLGHFCLLHKTKKTAEGQTDRVPRVKLGGRGKQQSELGRV